MSIRSHLRDIAEHALVRAPRRSHPGDRLVLAYHNVVPVDTVVTGDRSLHLLAGEFAQQLLIARQEATLVSLEELLVAPPTQHERLIAVTFDDAYRSALLLGLPLCADAGVSATVFVAPGLLGSIPPWDNAADRGEWSDSDRHQFLWTERGLRAADASWSGSEALRIGTESDLQRAMAIGDHRVANHTFHHPNLGSLSAAEVADEVKLTQRWLFERFPERSLPYLAYPFGIPPRDVTALAESSSVEYAFMVAGGWAGTARPSNRFLHPRWNVPAGISHNGFRLRLRGWFVGR